MKDSNDQNQTTIGADQRRCRFPQYCGVEWCSCSDNPEEDAELLALIKEVESNDART